jgi:hypothetical protein
MTTVLPFVRFLNYLFPVAGERLRLRSPSVPEHTSLAAFSEIISLSLFFPPRRKLRLTGQEEMK